MKGMPTRFRQHTSESMDVDESHVFSDEHRLILQYLMHARMAKQEDINKIHGKLFGKSESMKHTLSTIVDKINPLKMDIKQVICEVSGETYFVLIHTTGESFFPRCSSFNKSQLEFLKQVLTGIVLSDDCTVGKIQALNSCKGMSKSEGDETITQFIRDKILTETDSGALCLSPLTVVEFEPFFRSCLDGNLLHCTLCRQVVFVGNPCNGCNQKFHIHCVSKWLNSGRKECPECQEEWCDELRYTLRQTHTLK